jgi:D-amino-acid dehydrogenase
VTLLQPIAATAAPPARVAVVGAGVAGVAAAYALARRACRVTLVDARGGPGQGASFANGAQLSYAYTDALANPALLRRMPGLMFGADPAFRIRLHADYDQMLWLLRFLGQCNAAAFESNTLAGLALGLESRAALHALLERHPIDFAHDAPGKLHVHDQPAGLAAASALVALKRRHGAEQYVLTPDETLALEPALASRPAGMVGAIYSPQEEVGDPHRFCLGLTDVLTRHYDIATRFGETVADVRATPTEARLVLAGGDTIATDHILFCTATVPRFAPLRRALAGRVTTMKGYSFTAPPGDAAPRVSITDVGRKIVFCRLGDEIRVAGLAQLGFRDTDVTATSIAQLLDQAQAALPYAADYKEAGKFWAGQRPMTPNSLPVIEQVAPRISVNLGHGMLGWTWAMGAGERAAAMVGALLAA